MGEEGGGGSEVGVEGGGGGDRVSVGSPGEPRPPTGRLLLHSQTPDSRKMILLPQVLEYTFPLDS